MIFDYHGEIEQLNRSIIRALNFPGLIQITNCIHVTLMTVTMLSFQKWPVLTYKWLPNDNSSAVFIKALWSSNHSWIAYKLRLDPISVLANASNRKADITALD
jgi:hypothetical protein